MRCYALILCLLMIPLAASFATTCIVRPDGTGDFPTIMSAMGGVIDGDIIELDNGVYEGWGNRDVSFLGKAVTLRSRSNDPDSCTISCAGELRNPHRGFLFVSGEGPESRMCGITVRGSVANGVYPVDHGGAILCLGSSPTIVNCVFAANVASRRGGGIFCEEQSEPTIKDCRFLNNTCLPSFGLGGAAVDTDGGYVPVLACCDVFGNEGGDWVGCIADQNGLNGNFSLDPFFCDADNGDFHLWNYSPCNQEGCGLIGAWPVGCEDPAGIKEPAESAPGFNIWPSPATGPVRVSYAVPQGNGETPIILSIHDVLGRRLRTLIDGRAHPGLHWLVWDGRDERGTSLPAGTYFCRLSMGDEKLTRRVMVLR